MPDLTYYSGVSGFVEVYDPSTDQLTEHPATDWSIPIKATFIPRNNFMTAPYQTGIGGFYSGDFTVKIQYSSLFGSAPIVAGGTYYFYLGIADGLFYTVQGFVESLTPSNNAEGAPEVQLSCKSKGEFTITTP